MLYTYQQQQLSGPRVTSRWWRAPLAIVVVPRFQPPVALFARQVASKALHCHASALLVHRVEPEKKGKYGKQERETVRKREGEESDRERQREAESGQAHKLQMIPKGQMTYIKATKQVLDTFERVSLAFREYITYRLELPARFVALAGVSANFPAPKTRSTHLSFKLLQSLKEVIALCL